jgi:hypothetical protein
MINHYAPITPEKFDAKFLGRREILRVTELGAQLAFGMSVLDQRGFFKPATPTEDLADEAGSPMLTWPFLDFVDALDLRARRLVELGSGRSTLWFSARFGGVRSFETNPDWFATVSGAVGPNVELALIDVAALEAADLEYRGEDWMLVDFAGKRTKFLHSFFRKSTTTSTPAVFVLDNADWYRRGAAILKENGYAEIPFYGFKSGQSWISCTSVFIDPRRFAPVQKEPFVQPPFSRQTENRWDSTD